MKQNTHQFNWVQWNSNELTIINVADNSRNNNKIFFQLSSQLIVHWCYWKRGKHKSFSWINTKELPTKTSDLVHAFHFLTFQWKIQQNKFLLKKMKIFLFMQKLWFCSKTINPRTVARFYTFVYDFPNVKSNFYWYNFFVVFYCRLRLN